MRTEGRLGLQEDHFTTSSCELATHGQTDYPAANDDSVDLEACHW